MSKQSYQNLFGDNVVVENNIKERSSLSNQAGKQIFEKKVKEQEDYYSKILSYLNEQQINLKDKLFEEMFIPEGQMTWAPRKAPNSDFQQVKLFFNKVCKIDHVFQKYQYLDDTEVIQKNREKFIEYVEKSQKEKQEVQNRKSLLQSLQKKDSFQVEQQEIQIINQIKESYQTQLDKQLEKEGLRYDMLFQVIKQLRTVDNPNENYRNSTINTEDKLKEIIECTKQKQFAEEREIMIDFINKQLDQILNNKREILDLDKFEQVIFRVKEQIKIHASIDKMEFEECIRLRDLIKDLEKKKNEIEKNINQAQKNQKIKQLMEQLNQLSKLYRKK